MDLKQTRQLGPNLKTPSRSEWGKEGLQIRYRIPPNGVQKTSTKGYRRSPIVGQKSSKWGYRRPPNGVQKTSKRDTEDLLNGVQKTSKWRTEDLQTGYRIPPHGVQKTSKWGTENLEMMHRIPIKRAYQLPPTTCSWPNKKSFSISQNSFWDFEVWEIQHSRQIGQANLLVRSSSSRQCDQMATLFLNISKLTTIKISPITNFCQSWFSKRSIWPNNKEL